MDITKTLGHRIKLLRIQKKMKQQELAKLLCCSQTEISNWECGKRLIPTKYLLKLPEIFKVKLEKFNLNREFIIHE